MSLPRMSLKVKTFFLTSVAQKSNVFHSNSPMCFVVWENLSSHYSEIFNRESVTSRQGAIHLWQPAAKLA